MSNGILLRDMIGIGTIQLFVEDSVITVILVIVYLMFKFIHHNLFVDYSFLLGNNVMHIKVVGTVLKEKEEKEVSEVNKGLENELLDLVIDFSEKRRNKAK